MEYKTLQFKGDRAGQRKMNKTINKMARRGWVVSSTTAQDGRYGVGKTVGLGLLFLPLALLGKGKGNVTVVMQRGIA